MNIENELSSALAQHQSDNLPEAEKIYRAILSVSPQHPDATHLLGIIAFQRGDYATSVQLIQDAIQWHQTPPHYYFSNLANSLVLLNRLEEAVTALHRSIQMNPQNTALTGQLGDILKALGKIDEAILAYEQALLIQPGHSEILIMLGQTYADLGDKEKTSFYLSKMLTGQLNSPSTYRLIGTIFQRIGNYDEATYSYCRSLEFNGNKAAASPLRAYSNQWLRDKCSPLAGDVLSIGSGMDFDKEQSLYRHYFTNCSSYTRLDFDKEYHPDITGNLMDLGDVIKDTSYDVVFCIWVLEHVQKVDAAIDEIHRILKAGGTFVFGLPTNIGFHAFPHDYSRFTLSGIEQIFRDKFVITGVTEVGEREKPILDPRLTLIGEYTEGVPLGYVGLATKKACP